MLFLAFPMITYMVQLYYKKQNNFNWRNKTMNAKDRNGTT